MGVILLSHIIEPILPIRNRPSLFDHPAIEVGLAIETDSDDAPVTVMAAQFAADDGTTDEVGECQGRLLTAPPFGSVGTLTELTALRGINGIKRIRSP